MLIRLGTRQSALALWQANHISSCLHQLGHEVELVKITTAGDVSTTPLGQSGGQGVFTKEIQRALLDNRCDLAVHSLKDLPTEFVPGLALTVVPAREDAADCLISRGNLSLAELPVGATIGTGSPRRKAQLLHARPDLTILDIRGNVDTRLKKLDDGQYDAILLAYAGLHRLELANRISPKFDDHVLLPAVGQAALGLETRDGDLDTIAAIASLDDPLTHASVLAERSLLRAMRAGCLAPLAAHAKTTAKEMKITARVFSTDGSQLVSTENHVRFDEPPIVSELYRAAEQLGLEAAKQLTDQGGADLIQQSRAT
jgi:hydroxymethylbilane synthase